MAEYISKENALKIISICSANATSHRWAKEEIEKFLVDAVEVVRCKDCIYSYSASGDDLLCCEVIEAGYFLQTDHFCAFGKKRRKR